MGFLSEKEISHIIDGSVFDCAKHNFRCDRADEKSIAEHFEEKHTISGEQLCGRCQVVEVKYKNAPKPPEGKNPIVFCDDCKKALVAEIETSKSGQPESVDTFEDMGDNKKK